MLWQQEQKQQMREHRSTTIYNYVKQLVCWIIELSTTGSQMQTVVGREKQQLSIRINQPFPCGMIRMRVTRMT
jgi:hypothetical protein